MLWQPSKSVIILASLFLHASEVAGQASDKPTSPSTEEASTPAQVAQPSKSDRERAKRHFDLAVQLYKNGDYQTALAEFEASYLLFPLAPTLENIGRAQRALYQYPEAVASFQRYLQTAKKVTPDKREEIRAYIDVMRALLAEVTLTITPDGANVVIDGRSVGTSPLATRPLVAGRHEVEVSAPDHEPLRKNFLVFAGEPLAFTLRLRPIPRLGQLLVTASPAEAVIRIDGKLYGTGKVEVVLLPGSYTVGVSAPGYRGQQSELALVTGQTHSLNVWLEALPS